jgi:molybdopterin-guanine dinucleotide biosynthesis protein A
MEIPQSEQYTDENGDYLCINVGINKKREKVVYVASCDTAFTKQIDIKFMISRLKQVLRWMDSKE